MAFLGVLLGITITVLAVSIAYGWQWVSQWEEKARVMNEAIKAQEARSETLNMRNWMPVPLDTTPTAEKAKTLSVRRWSENIQMDEAK